MASYHYPIIAKEGWNYILLALVPAIGFTLATNIWAIPFWLLSLLLIFIFRDPHRQITSSPMAIVSPVEGTVVLCTPDHDEYLNRECIRLVIKIHWFGILSLRSPMEGKVNNSWLIDRNKNNHFQRIFWIQSDEEDDIVYAISGGFLWWKPNCLIHSGQRIGQGQRCGLMRFGSRVEVLLPASSRVNVSVGEKVVSGETILARLVH